MKRVAVAVIVLAVVAIPVIVRAQMAVFDPANWAEAVIQVAKLEQQYAQLVRTYEFLAKQATRMPGDLAARYRGTATPWLNLSVPDTYGVLGGWELSANTGHDVGDGYQAATERLRRYGPVSDEVPHDAVERMRRAYGAVELSDGITMHSLEMLGHVRNHSTQIEFALRRLEDDSFSGDDDLNTQVAVLNKINASAVTAARLTKDTNQILVAQLEQQLLESKRRRDAEAQAINAHIEWLVRSGDVLERPIADTTTTLRQFRMP